MSWRSLSDSLLRSSCTRGVFAIKKRSQYKVNRVPKVWHGGVFVSFQPYPWVQVEHQHGIRRALEARPFSLSGAPGAPVKIAAGITIRRHPSAHPAHPSAHPSAHPAHPPHITSDCTDPACLLFAAHYYGARGKKYFNSVRWKKEMAETPRV